MRQHILKNIIYSSDIRRMGLKGNAVKFLKLSHDIFGIKYYFNIQKFRNKNNTF